MRADLLGWQRTMPALAPVDADLVHLLQSWFSRGFLRMEPISWSSPASLLERVIRYEAVHDIADCRTCAAGSTRTTGGASPSFIPPCPANR